MGIVDDTCSQWQYNSDVCYCIHEDLHTTIDIAGIINEYWQDALTKLELLNLAIIS